MKSEWMLSLMDLEIFKFEVKIIGITYQARGLRVYPCSVSVTMVTYTYSFTQKNVVKYHTKFN